MAGIYSLRELSQRSQLLRSALIVACTYALMYLALDLIHVSDVAQLPGKGIWFYLECYVGRVIQYQ